MTVKQLKEELEKFDENLPVMVSDRCKGFVTFPEDDPDLSLEVYHDEKGNDTLFL